MRDLRRETVLIALLDALAQRGSWCGETHLQKSVYFLQAMLRVPLCFEFILYKYGPFSFDLREQLATMLANLVLSQESYLSYGPSFKPGPAAYRLKKLFPTTYRKFQKQISFVAEKLAGYDVAGLERLATALYVRSEGGEDLSLSDRADRLCELKPHISKEKASHAISLVDQLFDMAPLCRSKQPT